PSLMNQSDEQDGEQIHRDRPRVEMKTLQRMPQARPRHREQSNVQYYEDREGAGKTPSVQDGAVRHSVQQAAGVVCADLHLEDVEGPLRRSTVQEPQMRRLREEPVEVLFRDLAAVLVLGPAAIQELEPADFLLPHLVVLAGGGVVNVKDRVPHAEELHFGS